MSTAIVTDVNFSQASLQELREAAQTDIRYFADRQEFLNALRDVEILCAFGVPNDILERAPQLRWLQFSGAGTNSLQATKLLDPGSRVIVTSASGIHETQISEYVIGSMLVFNRDWPAMIHMQDRHNWPSHSDMPPLRQRELANATLGIVGLGHIGHAIAQRARAFGMKLLATTLSARAGDKDSAVDQLYPLDNLHELLAQSDYVVLSVPLTERTQKMIGEAELRVMRKNAYLINIARGPVIDQDALMRALKEGWIAGAGLDVAAHEPLPADSPLYTTPNLILTPHISGASEHYDERLANLFAENLRRYRSNQPLINRYNPDIGY